MSTPPLALFTDLTDLSIEPAKRILAEHGFRSDVLEVDASGVVATHQREAVALIVGYRQLTADLLAQFGSLGIIGTTSNGFDMIDLDHARERGIWVTNVGHAATEEVAVHTMSLILATERHLGAMQHIAREGGWTTEVTLTPRRLSTLTLGIVGFGKIGQAVAELAKPFFASVIVHDPSQTGVLGEVTALPLDEVVTGSDVLSLHLPLTAETHHIIDAKALASMRPGATLVNVSRGELVDETALLEALDTERLSAACFDVLDTEPPSPQHPMRTHPRVLLTPHVAFLSSGSLTQYEETAALRIAEWHENGSPSEWVLRGAEHSPMTKTLHDAHSKEQ